MTTPTAIAPASERAGSGAAQDWILNLAVDSFGRVDATGVRLATRGPVQVFVDGVLYDRDELAQLGGQTARHADADLVLSAYERHGDSLLPRLRGSFAVAIIDKIRNCITVARDPIGSHPVFYTEAGGATLVASAQHALLAAPGVSRALNRVALADTLCQRWSQVDETYFEAIKRLPGGCRLMIDPSGTRLERYWKRFEGPVQYLTEAEADRFDEQLARAVGRCFGRGRVGIFLSGGFDSVSIAAVATDHARKNGEQEPLALSLAFPHPECNEEVVQASVARQLGLPQELLDFRKAAGPRGAFSECLELNKRMGAPLCNTWAPSYLTLARIGRRQGVRTLVTGEGGDEWLNVSPYIAADFIRAGDLPAALRLAKTWHRSFNMDWRTAIRATFWTFGMRALVGAGISAAIGSAWDRNRATRRVNADFPWIAPDQTIRKEQKRRALERVVAARPDGGFYARELRAFLKDPLMPLLFEEQHQLAGTLGVRYQHPYWDADLVDHMYRTPPSVLTRGNRTKGLVRAAVDRRFPNLGFAIKRKVMALSFFGQLAHEEARALVPTHASFSALSDLGVVDPAGAREFVFKALDQTPRSRSLAWRLIVVESWARAQLGM
jgi:asparagine synthase (glutamine-hydrolysing)